MSFSVFISNRFISSNRKSKFLNLISIIAIAGIALGVATLIIALSVITGFEKVLTQKITDFDSHIKISSFKGSLNNTEENINRINRMVGTNLDFISPNISKLAIISNKKRKDGINIKGISNSDYIEKIKLNVIEGELDLSVSNNLVVGKSLASKLLLKPGDTVTLFALKNDKIPSQDNLPNIEKFNVVGIYESGIAEYDQLIGFTDISSAQKLFDLPDEINGIDVKLKSIANIDSLTNLLRSNLRYPYSVRSIFEIHKNIFTWIDLQKKPIPIVLGLIIIVAVFNIVGTLLLMVIEKTSAIGVLKSLGAKGFQIIKIFMLQGVYLAVAGVILGNLLAITLMLIQNQFNVIKVPSSVYFVTKVPLDFSLWIFGLVSAVTILLALVTAVLPSIVSSRINPINALRFD